jgi:hypothetical protein
MSAIRRRALEIGGGPVYRGRMPSDLRSFKPSTVVFNFLWKSAMAFLFDAACDSGGLPRSVALHYGSDLILVMSRWLFYGGGTVESP